MDIKEDCICFFKKKIGSGATSKVRANVNEALAQELHKPVIKRFKAADLAEMGSLFSKNQGVKYLLCVIDLFPKYTWVKPLKDKKVKTVFNDFNK